MRQAEIDYAHAYKLYLTQPDAPMPAVPQGVTADEAKRIRARVERETSGG